MSIDEYIEAITSTQASDWIYSEDPPYFVNAVAIESAPDGSIAFAEAKSHHGKATLRSNIDVSFYWGLNWTDDFPEPWATKKFSDKRASGSAMDFFFRGSLIFRQYYVHVDGARHDIPLPFQKITAGREVEYWIPRQKYEFFKMYNSMLTSGDFEFAFERTGIEIREVPWSV